MAAKAQRSYDAAAATRCKKQLEKNQVTVDCHALTVGAAYPSVSKPIQSPTCFPLFNLPPCVNDVALGYFMSSRIPGSRYEYLMWMYQQESDEPSFALTVRSVSLASLAQSQRQPKLMNMALQSYSKALAETNAALASPANATRNSTLLSTMLLSYFEVIVWTRPRAGNSWMMHLYGALALINLRGPSQFESRIGRILFTQVVNAILVNSVQRRVRVPAVLTRLLETAILYDCQCGRFQLTYLGGKVTDLSMDIAEGKMTPEEVIEKAESLDQEWVSFVTNISHTMRYKTKPVEAWHPEAYGKTVHEYPHRRVIHTWFPYRLCRMRLNSHIHSHAYHLPEALMVEKQRAASEAIEQMAEDICATVPQYMAAMDSSATVQTDTPCSPSCDVEEKLEPVSYRTIAASLLWPLWHVQINELASTEVRTWATERLKILGREYGVTQTETSRLEAPDFNALKDKLHMLFIA